MKKISIVFHSVNGNTYLIAKKFFEYLKNKNVIVNLFRVNDDDLDDAAQKFESAKEFVDDIKKVNIYDFKEILDSDIFIIGSPTYFGNVSSEMKKFMDEFVDYWAEGDFYGKRILSFASSGTAQGGGEFCLNAINIFGQHLGMSAFSIPSNLVDGRSFPAYGLLHYSGDNSDIRPDKKFEEAIEKMCDIITQ